MPLATFATTTELSSCDIDHMDYKPQNIDYLALYRKSADPGKSIGLLLGGAIPWVPGKEN